MHGVPLVQRINGEKTMDGRVVLVALGMSVTGPPAGEPLLAAELAEPTELEDEVNIADLPGLEFATGLTRLQLGAHAYPRENGTRTCRRRSGLIGLAGFNAGEHILCALTSTT